MSLGLDRLFFICSIKSPQCADKCSKKFFSIAIFLNRVLMCQKHQISLPVGYKTVRPKTGDWEPLWHQFRTPSLVKKQISPTFSYFLINNALLYHFLTNWLVHNKKMTEKSVFREAWSPELASQSFPVSCFLVSRFCTPLEVKFDAFGTSKHGEGKSLSKNFFATLISTLGKFNWANIKISVIYTLKCT